MTEDKFQNWLNKAKHGESVIYAPSAPFLTQENGTRRAAWAAHMGGLVELVQRRVSHKGWVDGGGLFDYIAIRKGN